MSSSLTDEQQEVIHHPLGEHARVLAVAGSGKSTTMAHRIKHLLEQDISPASIQVLTFNKLNCLQFIMHLEKIDLPESRRPSVRTFHGYSLHLMKKAGVLPVNTQFWLTDKAELINLTCRRAITNLEKAKRIPPELIDPEDAIHAIGLWKGALVPPNRAGSHNSAMPLVYQEFEALRLAESALTFDDFIPTAVNILESHPFVYQRYVRELRTLVVDEFQDLTVGQLRLIELLAGEQADIMITGDDDQLIYSFIGANPSVIQGFVQIFRYKPVRDYQLSRSFRFGPVIAQCAHNVITCNLSRVEKSLVAFQSNRPGFIHVFNGGCNSTKELTDQVQALVNVDKVPASEVIVLARLFAQLNNLEIEFLSRHIPYRVDGQEPFFKRHEIDTLLDYIRLAKDFQKPADEEIGRWLMNVANKPSRKLSRSLLSKLVSTAQYRHFSAQKLLEVCTQIHRLVWVPGR